MRRAWIIVAVLGLAMLGRAAAAPAASTTPVGDPAPGDAPSASLDTLIAAERAFSRASVEHGMKESFLAHLADDAIVFEPMPANGKRVWRARANPSGTLIWAPDFAELAGAGDLGVTSGPWEYRPPPERNAPTGYGHFVSVWRRAPGPDWRVALDIGIGHGQPPGGLDQVDVSKGPAHPPPPPAKREFGSLGYGFGLMSGSGFGAGFATGPGFIPRADRMMARAINAMMTAERAIYFSARTKGLARAYTEQAASDLRFYREGAPPAVGVSEAIAAIGAPAGRIEPVPFGDGMASSYDLGYSYGLLLTRATPAARADTSAYLHVWRKDAAGRWKLALDAENAVSKKP
jgi:ketosteroid isomerase-like protein